MDSLQGYNRCGEKFIKKLEERTPWPKLAREVIFFLQAYSVVLGFTLAVWLNLIFCMLSLCLPLIEDFGFYLSVSLCAPLGWCFELCRTRISFCNTLVLQKIKMRQASECIKRNFYYFITQTKRMKKFSQMCKVYMPAKNNPNPTIQ